MYNPDLVFSLGPNCRNTWNIRKYFDTDYAHPFDWWITPAKSMLRMLDRSFEFNVLKEDLYITKEEKGNSVYNMKLNLLHHHDFNRAHNNSVHEITDEAVEKLNSKYRYLFSRFWQNVDAAERPLAVLNGIYSGWGAQVPSGGVNQQLNGPVEPQELVTAIRDRIGSKTRVLIISIASGAGARIDLDGGTLISKPDRGLREDIPGGQSYAEPIHVFREAYTEYGLRPASLAKSETSGNLTISNNTPRVKNL